MHIQCKHIHCAGSTDYIIRRLIYEATTFAQRAITRDKPTEQLTCKWSCSRTKYRLRKNIGRSTITGWPDCVLGGAGGIQGFCKNCQI